MYFTKSVPVKKIVAGCEINFAENVAVNLVMNQIEFMATPDRELWEFTVSQRNKKSLDRILCSLETQ